MPRTVEEILQHADELAARFESYQPDPADKLDPAPSRSCAPLSLSAPRSSAT